MDRTKYPPPDMVGDLSSFVRVGTLLGARDLATGRRKHVANPLPIEEDIPLFVLRMIEENVPLLLKDGRILTVKDYITLREAVNKQTTKTERGR